MKKIDDFYGKRTIREWIALYPEYIYEAAFNGGVSVAIDTFLKIEKAVIDKWVRLHGSGIFLATIIILDGKKKRTPLVGRHFSNIDEMERFRRLLQRKIGKPVMLIYHTYEEEQEDKKDA